MIQGLLPGSACLVLAFVWSREKGCSLLLDKWLALSLSNLFKVGAEAHVFFAVFLAQVLYP